MTDLNRKYDILKEKLDRHEQILIQAYQSIKEKEKELIQLNERLEEKQMELRAFNKQLEKSNAEVKKKNAIITAKNAELEQAFNNLKVTQARLLENDKMASLGVLTNGIAHEINNPLNYMAGAYYLLNRSLSDKTDSDLQVQKSLSSLKLGIDRVSQMVQALNKFGRDTKSQSVICELNEIIDNCLILLKHKIGHQITVKANYHGPTRIRGNIGKFHEVFFNILTNSIDAISGVGEITITSEIKGEYTIIEIIDDGIGIPDSDLSKIIEPFFTTKDPGKGTGLGLSIAYYILRDHDIDLQIKSDGKKGTRVTLTIPRKIKA